MFQVGIPPGLGNRHPGQKNAADKIGPVTRAKRCLALELVAVLEKTRLTEEQRAEHAQGKKDQPSHVHNGTQNQPRGH